MALPQDQHNCPSSSPRSAFPAKHSSGDRPRGLLIAFVGIDGCGKGTQIELLKTRLTQEGFADRLVFSKQPGGTPVGTEVRRILFETVGSKNMSPITYQVLCAASHVESCASIIGPALADGKIIICDRWHPYCSYAYHESYRFPIPSIEPDMVVHLWGKPQTFMERALSRTTETHQKTKPWNQAERLEQIQNRYFEQLENLPSCVAVRADNKSAELIAELLWHHIEKALHGHA